MRDDMQAGMAEATRLTREGRLAEATALIRRALGGAFISASPDGSGDLDEPIEATSRAVNKAPRSAAQPKAPSQPDTPSKYTLRRAPMPSRRYRSVPRTPDAAPGAIEDAPTPPSISTRGQFVERSYTNRAGTRAYKLYVPSGYVGQAVPLIIMLHGCTQSPDDLSAGTRMNMLAEEHTFLVAYPAQAATANISRCWNWFQAADQQRGQGEPSIIAGITRQIVGEYNAASGQVYVAGMSAGGAMAAIVGAAYPDLYAAIGVHSGLVPGAAHDLSSAFSAMKNGGPATPRQDISTAEDPGKSVRIVPAIVFHGDRDRTVHPRNADRLIAHWIAAGETTASGQSATGGSASPVTARQGQVLGGHAYTCATYHETGGRAVIERWTIHGLGHAWSGGSKGGSYTDPKGPDASAEMVRFFHQHPQQREPMERTTD